MKKVRIELTQSQISQLFLRLFEYENGWSSLETYKKIIRENTALNKILTEAMDRAMNLTKTKCVAKPKHPRSRGNNQRP